MPRETFLLKTGTEVWYQRWLWDGIFWDPSQKISKAKSRKIPNPRDWDFSRLKSQKIPKIYYKNKKHRINHRGIFVREIQKSLYQKNPRKSRKIREKSLKSKRKSQEIAAKIDESETYFVPKSPKDSEKIKKSKKNWKIRFRFFKLFLFRWFYTFFWIFGKQGHISREKDRKWEWKIFEHKCLFPGNGRFRGHPRSSDPKFGVDGVICGQNRNILKPGQLIYQKEAQPLSQLPRAKREAKKWRPVNQLSRAKREVKKGTGPTIASSKARGWEETCPQIISSEARG